MALDYRTYKEAKDNFRWSERWSLFDGTKEKFNITNECIDRHPESEVALRIKFEDGKSEIYSFGDLKRLTTKFAAFLELKGINFGDRVALLLFPSLEFYVSMFGIFKRGAVAVPCFPLFGPDAVDFRLEKSEAKAIVTTKDRINTIDPALVSKLGLKFIIAEELIEQLEKIKDHYNWETNVNSVSMIQFSSGTTGAPKSIVYRHGAITVAAVVMKFSVGLTSADNYFCPSSPAWGHGIWYGTISPLIFGNAIGSFSGKFDSERCLEALEEWKVTNMAAISSHYRLIMESGKSDAYDLRLEKLSYTGEPMTRELLRNIQERWGVTPCCQYGTTEVGPVTLDYAGFEDYVVKPGSLGKPMIGGLRVAILDKDDRELPPGTVGQIALWRDGRWTKIGDSAYRDDEDYFWYVSRMDDVIISSGYTIGPAEVEEALRKHNAVEECAVIGSPDKDRGDIVKAFIKLKQDFQPRAELSNEIKDFVKIRLSRHEYPREIEFVEELPKTPDGKLKRKELRELERMKKGEP